MKGHRDKVRLFAWNEEKKAWQALPLQVDPVDADGRLVFSSQDKWKRAKLQASDLLSFRSLDFGRRLDQTQERLPCQGDMVFELFDPKQGRYAYLTSCSAGSESIKFPYLVRFDTKNHTLASSQYRYRFNPENYMQFETIEFADDKNKSWDLVAQDSRLLIRADVKNFFNMNFDSDDVESQLEVSRLGPVGNLARLSFFLRILFFKIKMSLSTDVGFYENSGHIPMMVTLPVNAVEYLNPGSGILYSWVVPEPYLKSPATVKMPKLDVKELYKGHKSIASLGTKYCQGSSCFFSFGFDFKGRYLSMDFDMERKLVDRGFFPLFVEDVAAYHEAMGWKIKIPKGQKRVGIYFEVSGLGEGGHPWNFWLRLGDKVSQTTTCPYPVKASRLEGAPSQR